MQRCFLSTAVCLSLLGWCQAEPAGKLLLLVLAGVSTGATQPQLAAAVEVQPRHIRNLLAGLVRRGLVSRIAPGKGTRRQLGYRLTAANASAGVAGV